MIQPVKNIFIVTKGDNPKAKALNAEVCDFLQRHGVETTCCDHLGSDNPCLDDDSGQPYDLALVLGGDGTFIAAARKLLLRGVPLMGVNFGQVGFLADLSADDWREGLSDVVRGNFSITPRLVLAYAVVRGGEVIRKGLAVNEIVISRGMLARLIRLGFSYDGMSVISMRSDGVIVCTPTGSTAYGVSAGGPLLMPEVEAFSVVPICPFLNGFKPLVLPAGKVLEIQVQGEAGDVSITEDGQAIVDLASGDEVVVRRCDHDLLLAETSRTSYFDKLKSKGFLLER